MLKNRKWVSTDSIQFMISCHDKTRFSCNSVQTTEQDVREKGLLLSQRINDTFLKYVDEIKFYYRDGVKQDAVLAAK